MIRPDTKTTCQLLASYKQQIFATVVANICCFGQGCAVGWTAPTLPLLLSADSPLAAGPIDAATAAWVAAILPVGAVCGTLSFGLLSTYVGSKHAVLACAVPLMLHWVIVWAATQAWQLVGARFLSGLAGGGLYLCMALFVAEIAGERVRGGLSSLLQVSVYSGVVGGYVACDRLDYATVPAVLVAFPIVFVTLFAWLPSAPQHLLACHQPERAERSLRWYRNVRRRTCEAAGDAAADDERQLRDEFDKFVLIARQNAEQPPVTMQDFLTRDAVRGMLIGPTLMAVGQFSGTFVLLNYAHTIISAAGGTATDTSAAAGDIDPHTAAVILGGIQVLGCVCASMLIDRVGRRCLLLVSCAGSAVALCITGAYAYLMSGGGHAADALAGLGWLPVASLSTYIFLTAVGVTPVPYVLVAEMLPQRVRRVGATICVSTVSLFSGTILRVFPWMLAALGLHWCMWVFAGVSAIGFVFTLVVVEETKGRNLDVVQKADGNNATAVTESRL